MRVESIAPDHEQRTRSKTLLWHAHHLLGMRSLPSP